jgi:TatD DNase family protein
MGIQFIDIHNHHQVFSEGIISIPSFFLQDINFNQPLTFPFTAGIHPWHAEKFNLNEIKVMLEYLTCQHRLIAVGETGLDKKCISDFGLQKTVFRLHVEFAEKNHKPLMIHCVNSWNEMIAFSKQSKVPFILHGYSAGIELTKQLIHHGFYFSIGNAIMKNSYRVRESIQLIPITSIFFETDDEMLDISEIYNEASLILRCSVEDLKRQIFNNYNNIFEGFGY